VKKNLRDLSWKIGDNRTKSVRSWRVGTRRAPNDHCPPSLKDRPILSALLLVPGESRTVKIYMNASSFILADGLFGMPWSQIAVGGTLVGVIVACLLLILIVLVQKPQGGGLAGAFGSGAGSGQTAFGTRTGDALTWLTISFFVLYLGASIGMNYLTKPAALSSETKASAPATTPVSIPVSVPSDVTTPEATTPGASTPPATGDAPVVPAAPLDAPVKSDTSAPNTTTAPTTPTAPTPPATPKR
jgi:preprotein translocase subunit SecG